MAERKRGAGFLHQRVLRLLKAAHPHPRTGLELAEMLQAEGDMVSVSQVYRALKRLIDEGAIRKILVAGGYAPIWQDTAILLWCRSCGEVTEVASPVAFARLLRAAEARGLARPECRIEVPGICAVCAGCAAG